MGATVTVDGARGVGRRVAAHCACPEQLAVARRFVAKLQGQQLPPQVDRSHRQLNTARVCVAPTCAAVQSSLDLGAMCAMGIVEVQRVQ